jgi:hypothetical protein
VEKTEGIILGQVFDLNRRVGHGHILKKLKLSVNWPDARMCVERKQQR